MGHMGDLKDLLKEYEIAIAIEWVSDECSMHLTDKMFRAHALNLKNFLKEIGPVDARAWDVLMPFLAQRKNHVAGPQNDDLCEFQPSESKCFMEKMCVFLHMVNVFDGLLLYIENRALCTHKLHVFSLINTYF